MSVKTLSKLTIFGYGLGHVCNDICASMWFTYLLLFFQKVLGIGRSDAALLLLIGQFADGISTTLLGLVADKIGLIPIFRRYGKRKSLHLFGSLCVFATFPFIFIPTVQDMCSDQQMLYYPVFIVIFQFGWAAVQISHLSLITDLTNDENTRTLLTSVRYGFTVISNLLVYITTWIFFGFGDSSQQVGHGDAEKFRNIMIVGVSCGGVATLCFHLLVREDSSEVRVSEEKKCENPGVVSWLLNPNLYFVACVYMATRLYVNLTQAYIPFYLQDSVRVSSSFLAIIPLIQYVTSFLCSFATNKANKVAGRHVTWVGGAVLGCLAALIIQLLPDPAMRSAGIFVIAIIVGCSSCVMLITSLGLTADLIGPHVQSGALIYGLMSLTDKLSNGLAVLVIQGQIPCLTTFEILWLPLVKVAELLPNSCDDLEDPCTHPPVPVTSTVIPDFGGDICFSFYKTVLTIATSSTSIFGALFVILMLALSRYRKQREERIEKNPIC